MLRRNLLKLSGAAVVIAVAPKAIAKKETGLQRFHRLAKAGGLICDDIFIIDGPLILDRYSGNATFSWCRFIFTGEPRAALIEIHPGTLVDINHSYFESKTTHEAYIKYLAGRHDSLAIINGENWAE